MENRIKAILCAALLLASCTKVRTYDIPPVEDYGLTIISASISPIEIDGLGRLDAHQWVETDTIGVYGSEKGENAAYIPLQDGSLNRFCGDIVKGGLTLYYPYSGNGNEAAKSGRMPLKSIVQYKSDAASFVFSNVTFVTKGDKDEFSFGFPLGMVKMSLAVNAKDCKSVSITVSNTSEGYDEWICGDLSVDGTQPAITNGGRTVLVQNVGGRDISEAAPLDILFAAPQAKFENLIISIETHAEEPLVQVCKGPLQIKTGCMTNCKVVEYKPEYGFDRYGSESGSYK